LAIWASPTRRQAMMTVHSRVAGGSGRGMARSPCRTDALAEIEWGFLRPQVLAPRLVAETGQRRPPVSASAASTPLDTAMGRCYSRGYAATEASNATVSGPRRHARFTCRAWTVPGRKPIEARGASKSRRRCRCPTPGRASSTAPFPCREPLVIDFGFATQNSGDWPGHWGNLGKAAGETRDPGHVGSAAGRPARRSGLSADCAASGACAPPPGLE